MLVTLDGRAVVDSRRGLDCSFFDSVYFAAPIDYPVPDYRYTTDTGVDVFADAALWVKGIATVLPPLLPGHHTIHLTVDTGAGYGYDNTWNLTVRPPKRR